MRIMKKIDGTIHLKHFRMTVTHNTLLRPPFDTFPELTGDRILLLEMLPEHAHPLHEIMFFDGQASPDQSETVAIIHKIREEYLKGNTVNWVVLEKQHREPIGTIGYYRGFEQETGEIGFVQRPAFREQGYMSEALKLIVKFGLEHMRLRKIIAITSPSNEPAVRLLNRNQFNRTMQVDAEYAQYVYQP